MSALGSEFRVYGIDCNFWLSTCKFSRRRLVESAPTDRQMKSRESSGAASARKLQDDSVGEWM